MKDDIDGKSLLILFQMILYFMTFILWLGYITDPKEFTIMSPLSSTIFSITCTILYILSEYKITTTLKLQKNHCPEIYYQFTLIDLRFFNTFQVCGFNIILFNVFFSILHIKPTIKETIKETNQ